MFRTALFLTAALGVSADCAGVLCVRVRCDPTRCCAPFSLRARARFAPLPVPFPSLYSTQYTTSPWFDNPGSIPSGRNPGPSFNARNGNAPYASCSCCSANYSNTLASGGEGAIYRGFNYTCPGRPLSPECLFYLQAQEADFACNPNTQSLYYATVIPLCTTYIQAWWDACKNDYTCQADWVAWPQDSTGYMTCQAMNRPCMKYADIYKSATNLTFQWGAQNSVYSVSSDAAVWCVVRPLPSSAPGRALSHT